MEKKKNTSIDSFADRFSSPIGMKNVKMPKRKVKADSTKKRGK